MALNTNITHRECGSHQGFGNRNGLLIRNCIWNPGEYLSFYHYLLLHFTVCRVRCTNLVLRHLIAANSLVILSKGVLQTMAAFGLRYFPSDVERTFIFRFKERLGVYPSAAPASWVSSKPLWSIPGTPGGKSWKWEPPSVLGPPLACTGSWTYW